MVSTRFSAVTLAGLVWVRPAAADPAPTPVELEITRAPGAESCPDEARVFEAVARLFPEQPLSRSSDPAAPVLDVSIAIAPLEAGHEARLRVRGRRAAERQIVDRDPACAGLADALAVALVLWSNSPDEQPVSLPPESASEPAPEPPPDPAQPNQPAAVPPPERTGSGRARPFVLGVEGNALAGFGLLGEPAFGATAGLSAWSVLGVGVGARVRLLRAVAASVEVPPGVVDVDLWAGLFAACARFEAGSLWSIVPCVEVGWGEQRAESRGLIAENDEARRRWLALGPNASVLFRVAGPLRLMGTGSLLVHLHDQSYAVDDRVVESHPRTGGYVGLGALAEWDVSAKNAGR